MINLFAVCGPLGQVVVKRVRTSNAVQQQLEGVFLALEEQFRFGIHSEVDFDGRWKPDDDELLKLPVTPEAEEIVNGLQDGALAVEELSVNQFETENIRALCVRVHTGQHSRVLVQAFSLQQRLSRRFALLSDGNTFNKLDQPAFAIASQIDMVIEGGLVKFRKFYQAKRILDLSAHYREATDGEVQSFCNSEQFLANFSEITVAANPTIRRLIGSVQNSGILTSNTATDLIQKANNVGVALPTENDRIKLPTASKELKRILTFLDHGVYKSPLTEETYITNSRRRLN